LDRQGELAALDLGVTGGQTEQDDEEGHWTSPSNHEVLGIVELETSVTWDFQNTSTQANALNEVGICTMGKPYGSGWRFWGNRFAQYPTDLAVDNFISVRRVADILHESVELAMLPFIDKPITNAIIASIKETVNSYMRSLVQRGALISGDCTFDPAKNPPAQVAAGQLVFDLDFMPPTPAERITFESFINIQRLVGIGA
jgi:phage tail sheath protein FI